MDETAAATELAHRFEDQRAHLTAVAYRMLGSLTDADDAVQEAWLRLNRTDVAEVDNLTGWLTTVVSRVCLDMLRSRKRRAEVPIDEHRPDEISADDPEREAVIADGVGMAMVVVLGTLPPAERVAFVLHDMFAVSFDDIATVLGRTPAATRQLASRARRKVQSGQADRADNANAAAAADRPQPSAERQVVDAFLAASRAGDFAALLAILDPEVVLRADATASRMGAAGLFGAQAVAERFSGQARAARPAVLDGEPGLVWTQRGQTKVAFDFLVENGRIVEIELVADEDRLAAMQISY